MLIITPPPRTIFEESTLDAMALIEYPDHGPNKNQTKEEYQALLVKWRENWKAEQLDASRRNAYEYSWLGARAMHDKMLAEFTPQELAEWRGAIHVIYGVGGWHRYMVTIEGHVHFSFHHATKQAQERAMALGFLRW